MSYLSKMVYAIANINPLILVFIILLVSLICGAITFFLKKDEKLFWSLFAITFADLFLGFFFLISINVYIGLILLILLLAMMINKYLKARRKAIN
ncbi:hypothetical protein [Planococcus salinarum]|uniref:hypothetical protein n=1 Tax=Planococcus salinarum TaxID=622695 RepID=UPI000E3EC833|nr:hypothetical protein [Planococcus salinarum]TAA67112.1 hypothetical protein D2909_14870 [Planococcus salinarum]